MNEEKRSVTGANPLGVLALLVQTIQLVWRLMLDSRVPNWNKVVVPAALLYILSPIDLLPDLILGLGQVDDIGILMLSVRLFIDLCPPHVVEEHRRALGARNSRPDTPGDETIEGTYRVMDED